MPGDERIGASFSIDVTALKAGLAQANRLIRESESEFKAAAAGMDDWSKSEEGLTKKIKSLEDITEIQRKKVEALTAEYDDLIADGLDPASSQATELRTKINNETAALNKNEKELKKQKEALENLGEQSEETGEALENTGGAAENASEGFTVMKGAAADLVAKGITALVGACKNAVTSLLELSSETQEYREDIGKLNTAFEAAGKSTDTAKKIYQEFYSVLGEEDRSVEAVNHLAKLVETEEDMAKWADIAAGVWGTFGDSLPIEGLTEASNETAKVGKLTGVLADALNWAGVNEDDFQASLDKCSTEQERQRLITDTLNGLYSEAAALYRKNNKSVIDARKATSAYTDEMADLGAELEPVNQDITELKTTLAREFAPVLKKQVAPAIKDFVKQLKNSGAIERVSKLIGFAAEHFEQLAKGTFIAVSAIAAFSAAMKITTAVTAAKTAVEGLTAGVGLATKAQALWNAAMSANPIGAVITAVGLLAGGIALLTLNSKEATKATDLLSEEQRAAVTAAEEAAESYRDTKAAAEEMAGAELANINYTQTLWQELQTLADENGNVKKGYEGRAQFILNELNNALGTEYTLNGNVIEQYQEIKKSIDDVIQSKKAQILLDAYQETYAEAVKNVAEAEKARATQLQELVKQEEVVALKRGTIAGLEAQLKEEADARTRAMYRNQINSAKKALEEEEGILSEKQAKYDKTESSIEEYYANIDTYETASTLVLQGETAKAVELLSQYGGGFKTAASTAQEGADKQKKILEQQVIDTEINLRIMEEDYKTRSANMTEEEKKQAKARLAEAKKQANNAKTEFKKVGGNITEGIAEGSKEKKWTLNKAMENIISSALAAARKKAEEHSPSRLFRREVGKNLGLGVALGIDDSTKNVVNSVKSQVDEIQKAYDVSSFAAPGVSGANGSNGTTSPAANGKSVIVYQTNNYSQAHSRFELYKSKQETAAAVRLAMGTV